MELNWPTKTFDFPCLYLHVYIWNELGLGFEEVVQSSDTLLTLRWKPIGEIHPSVIIIRPFWRLIYATLLSKRYFLHCQTCFFVTKLVHDRLLVSTRTYRYKKGTNLYKKPLPGNHLTSCNLYPVVIKRIIIFFKVNLKMILKSMICCEPVECIRLAFWRFWPRTELRPSIKITVRLCGAGPRGSKRG